VVILTSLTGRLRIMIIILVILIIISSLLRLFQIGSLLWRYLFLRLWVYNINGINLWSIRLWLTNSIRSQGRSSVLDLVVLIRIINLSILFWLNIVTLSILNIIAILQKMCLMRIEGFLILGTARYDNRFIRCSTFWILLINVQFNRIWSLVGWKFYHAIAVGNVHSEWLLWRIQDFLLCILFLINRLIFFQLVSIPFIEVDLLIW